MERFGTIPALRSDGSRKSIQTIEWAMTVCKRRAKRSGMCARFYGRIRHKRAIFEMVGHPYFVGRSNSNCIYSLRHPAAPYCYEWAVYFTESRSKKTRQTNYSYVSNLLQTLRENQLRAAGVAIITAKQIDTRIPCGEIPLEQPTANPCGEISLKESLEYHSTTHPRFAIELDNSARTHLPNATSEQWMYYPYYSVLKIEALQEEVSKLRAENDALKYILALANVMIRDIKKQVEQLEVDDK